MWFVLRPSTQIVKINLLTPKGGTLVLHRLTYQRNLGILFFGALKFVIRTCPVDLHKDRLIYIR